MTKRHFQYPWDASPESQASKEGGGKIKILLDEKSGDDRGQRRTRPLQDTPSKGAGKSSGTVAQGRETYHRSSAKRDYLSYTYGPHKHPLYR